MASPRVFTNAIGSLAGRSPQSVRRVAAAIMNSPETLAKLPRAMRDKLSSGDPQAIAEVVAYVSGTAAAGVGVVGGAMNAASSPADLSDGLAGAPQEDITPEPVAGEAPPIPQPSPPPPSRKARPSDTPLAPPEVMSQADIDYVNSLPQNSPEAMLRKAKRWDESDRRMEDLESRLRERLGTDISEAELASLQAGGVPPSFDPGSLGRDERLPSVGSARPRSYSNPNTFDPMAQADPRQSFRDVERAEDMRRRSQGAPVEAQRERDFASGQYGDFDQRLQDQSRWAQSMQIDPEGRGFGPTDFQRRYNPKESREWYDQNVVPRIRERAQGELAAAEAKQQAERDTPHGSTNLYDAKLERADLERRVKTYARQKGLSYEQSLEALSAAPGSPFNALKETLPGDKYTLAERNSSHQDRMKNNAERKAEMDLRRERLATRGLYGLNQAQANAYVALGDPNLSDEQRLAAEYTLNPRKFMVDYATAQNPPKGDGSGFDPVTDNALRQQYAAGYKSGTESAKSRMRRNRNWDGTSKAPRNAREWEDWRQEALEGLAINSAEYDGALKWFEDNFGAQPPGDREEPKQSGVPSSGARQGGRRGGR